MNQSNSIRSGETSLPDVPTEVKNILSFTGEITPDLYKNLCKLLEDLALSGHENMELTLSYVRASLSEKYKLNENYLLKLLVLSYQSRIKKTSLPEEKNTLENTLYLTLSMRRLRLKDIDFTDTELIKTVQ